MAKQELSDLNFDPAKKSLGKIASGRIFETRWSEFLEALEFS